MSNNAKLLICGGRHFDDYSTLEAHVKKILSEHSLRYENIEIVSGHCEGADRLGERFAAEHGVPVKLFPADWKKYGRAAGPIRNKQMVDYISEFPDSIVLGFVSENSKGTKNTIKQAQTKGILTVEIPYSPSEVVNDG